MLPIATNPAEEPDHGNHNGSARGDPMASGPPGEAEKLFEALGKHIATRPGQPLHYTDASVYLGTRLWSTKFGFVEMPKKGISRASVPLRNRQDCMFAVKAAHLDDHEEQETKNTVNNIFTGLMLLPATKRHSILKLLMTASTLATAKGHEMRPLGITDESYVRLEVQISLSSGMMIAFFVGPVILGATLLMGWWIHGWMVEGLSILRSCVSFHRARRARRSMTDD